MKERVVIGYPHGGKIDGKFTQSLIRVLRFEDKYPSDRYELLDPIDAVSIYTSENRNTLVRKAQSLKADWLFQIDPDETFDETIVRIAMRTADKERRSVIVGVYANIGDHNEDGSVTLVDCLYQEMDDGTYLNVVPESETEPLKVDAAGTGLFLTHMSVFEKLGYPWFMETYIQPTGGVVQFMNEDIAFCRKLREAGYEIWCDPLVQATHWKTLPISTSLMGKLLGKAEKYRRELGKESVKETELAEADVRA